MKILSVQKIWDRAEHNAFTDLVRCRGQLYCVLREGDTHVSQDGALRLLCSADEGLSWHSVARLAIEGGDLRDGKLLVAGDRLYIFSAVLRSEQPCRSLFWSSADAIHWDEAELLADDGYWLWRVSRGADGYYGVGYRPGPGGDVRLYRAPLGEGQPLSAQDFCVWVECLSNQGYVNESSMLFEDNAALCLLRRDPVWDERKLGLLGKSTAPYKDWQWLELDCRIGGPVAFRWRGQLMAVVRLYDDKVRTALVEICETTGHVCELLSLPSGGDTSYAGVVLEQDTLLVSYYSTHEGKTAVYFARLKLE
ncbi:exo-alpha-sialidase [Shewanella cyperi]|uniref:Exo-alpha-sialidase n=1 Tax=Shewanella cyperi TaxID=2814292 RepID=A0A975AJ05_9GAMM|nr:exo-alpha-sialidase [Shewanella cyperi]QSX28797.1 exo-alpha-sialidase [Shewanella cyperi]